jgi:hypothetical protein
MGSDFTSPLTSIDSSRSSQWHSYQSAFGVKLKQSFAVLGVTVEHETLQELAAILVDCMTGRYRSFHTPDHILQVAEGGDAIEVLAALFHDVVYIQVDSCIPAAVQTLLMPFCAAPSQSLKPLAELLQDPDFDLVTTIFEIERQEEVLPQQNEFLSAIVAVKCLKPFLDSAHLAQVTACIEATIPFRVCVKEGIAPSDRLYHNLCRANEKFGLGLSPEALIEATKRSVRLANRDVKNFADVKASSFLDNTWKLLPETNPPLRNPQSYTPLQYRFALQKMVGFMDFLAPDLVFRQFQGEPSPTEYQEMLDRAEKNIEVARLYLKAKLVALAFVEALSHPQRQSIPLVDLVGCCDLPLAGIKAPMEEISSDQHMMFEEVMTLLEVGRNQDTAFDIRHSPLAARLVKTYGFQVISDWFDDAQAFFADQLSPEEFLARHPHEAIDVCVAHLKLPLPS